jgi:hypothetical protein
MSIYVRANTDTPTGFRPWNYKMSGLNAYYEANFVLPGPNEVGKRLSGSFNRPGGMTSTNWGNKDNPGAPRPIYRPPESLPGHYARGGLGLVPAPLTNGSSSGSDLMRVPMPITRITNNYYSGQPSNLTVPATSIPIPATVVDSSGQPVVNPLPATAVPAATTSSVTDMFNQALAWLQTSTLISSFPNYVPVGAAIAAYMMFSSRNNSGRRR